MEHNHNAIGVICHQHAVRIKLHDHSGVFHQSGEKTGRCQSYFGSWGQALLAVAVVERFKQESMLWILRRDKIDVAVSGASTVFIFWRLHDSLTAALSTLSKDSRFEIQESK